MLPLNPAGSFGTLILPRQRLPKVTGLVTAHTGSIPFFLPLPPAWSPTPAPMSPPQHCAGSDLKLAGWISCHTASLCFRVLGFLLYLNQRQLVNKGLVCSAVTEIGTAAIFYPADYTQCVSKLQPAATKISQRGPRCRCEQ